MYTYIYIYIHTCGMSGRRFQSIPSSERSHCRPGQSVAQSVMTSCLSGLYIYIYIYMYSCVCIYYMYVHIYIYIYIYTCLFSGTEACDIRVLRRQGTLESASWFGGSGLQGSWQCSLSSLLPISVSGPFAACHCLRLATRTSVQGIL